MSRITLEERAGIWIQPFSNARHLVRTLDWLLALDPDAEDALRLAALTHDMERNFPGGPVWDPGTMDAEATEYRREHSERSATIVCDWLLGEGADESLIENVGRLVRAHEVGGSRDEDLLQAADSLSFLETNAELVASWYTSGRCDRRRARVQLRYMLDRMNVPEATELARPLYREALATVQAA